jgi:hypothetical protein
MFHLLRLLVILPALALILPLSAQEKAKQTRTVRFLFLNAPQNAPYKVHLHDGLTSQEVELPRMNLSPIYDVPSGPLKLRLLAAPVEDPKLVPPEAPGILIPETIGDAYLLCFSDPANPVLPVQIKVVDAGKGNFRDGQMMWFNLTPYAIGGKLGDKRLILKPHGRELVDAPDLGEEGCYSAVISFMITGDNRVHPICETRWMHDMSCRHLVFVFIEPDRRLPRITGFSDFRPPPPPNPKPEEANP